MERELRRHENTLLIIGLGVIVFAVWSIVKMVMALLLAPDTVVGPFLQDFSSELPEKIVRVIMTVMILFFLVLDVSLRIYVGRSAVKEAQTGKKRTIYLFWAGFLALSNGLSLVSPFQAGTTYYLSGIDMVVTCLIDLTSFIMLIQLIRSGVIVRRLRKAV